MTATRPADPIVRTLPLRTKEELTALMMAITDELMVRLLNGDESEVRTRPCAPPARWATRPQLRVVK